MTDEQVIDRIRKCLALTTSSNPGEAANAAAMVQKLLFKYKLTMADVNVASEDEGPIGEQTLSLNHRKHEGKWKKNLVYSIARYNFCRMIGSYDGDRAFIIGSKNDIEIVQAIYHWVVEQLIEEEKVAWDHSCRHNLFRRSFFTGAVQVLNNRLYHQWYDLQHETEASTALVVSNEAALKAYIDKAYGELRKGTHSGSVGSRSGYYAGREAGSKVSLSRPTRPLAQGGLIEVS